MKKILSAVMVIVFGISLRGQETETGLQSSTQDSPQINKKPVARIATIKTMDNKKITGWFYTMDADNIYLLPASERLSKPLNDLPAGIRSKSVPVRVEQINTISLQRKNAGLKGALIGFGVGALTGVIIGYASGSDPVYENNSGNPIEIIVIGVNNAFARTAGEKALGNGIALGLTGALTGFLIGELVKTKFFIGGQKENYQNQHGELKKWPIMY